MNPYKLSLQLAGKRSNNDDQKDPHIIKNTSVWVFFFVCVCVCVHVCTRTCTTQTVAYQAPLSMEFPRKEYWSRVAIFFSSGSS